MKRLLVLVLLVPILALTMISCDADMRSNLAGFMGGFGGNVYADAGLIVVNTAQAEAAAATVAAIGTGAGAEDPTTTSLGVTITVPGGVTKILAPQTPAKQKELKDNLGDAFNSDTQKKKLLEDLKKEATPEQKTAAEGTREVFNATLAALDDALNDASVTDPSSKQLGDALKKLALPPIGDKPTQADLLTLQLMTDLISNTVNALKDISGEDDLTKVDGTKLEANKTKVLSIIDDALFAAEVAEQISGAASIDFTGQIDLGALLDGLDNKGTGSRNIPLTDAAVTEDGLDKWYSEL